MNVIVITGAARGMGRACLERLRAPDVQIIAVDLDVPEIDATIGVACDVSDPDAVAGLASQVRDLGAFRCLVHAAGISPTMGTPRRVFEVDLLGTQHLLDAFESLVVSGSSAVCFASSAAYQVALLGPDADTDAFVEDPGAADVLDEVDRRFTDSGYAYAWAKRGVIRAAARAAARWGPLGGRVNSVSPGLIDTGMGRQELEAQPMMQVMLDATPLGRLGTPDEIAALVAWLVSDEASFVSGVDILADGGGLEGMRRLLADADGQG